MVHSFMSPHSAFEPTHQSPFHALPHPQQFQPLAHSRFWNISNTLIPNPLRTLPKNRGIPPSVPFWELISWPSLSSAHHFTAVMTTSTLNMECGAPAPPLTNQTKPTSLPLTQDLTQRADCIRSTLTASIADSRSIHKHPAITLRPHGLTLDNPKSSANIPMLSV
jgi:hypothetical protein